MQVDVDPLMVGWTTPVARAVLADAARFLEHLVKLHGGAGLERAAGTVARVAPLAGDVLAEPAAASEEVPFTPQRVISTLNRLVPEDAIVTADAGENRLFMMRWYASKRPGGYLQPAAGGGMGHAVPAALGAKLAYPQAPAVAVCGDGGFAMSMHGLMTAIEEQLPIAVVVFNNGVLGWVLHGMGEQVVAADLSSFDYAADRPRVGLRRYPGRFGGRARGRAVTRRLARTSVGDRRADGDRDLVPRSARPDRPATRRDRVLTAAVAAEVSARDRAVLRRCRA